MRPLRVFHAYSGLDSWGVPFRDHGHQVITLDFNPAFGADLTMDIREFAKEPQRYLDEVAVKKGWIKPGEHWLVEVYCLGPDCKGLSVAALGKNWRLSLDAGYIMRTDSAKNSVELVVIGLDLVPVLKPKFWILENPRAILRKIAYRTGVGKFERVGVTYCAYGMPYQKPTDVWGMFPPSWKPRPMCKPSAPCHESAPRGSRRGIQRIGSSAESEGFEKGPVSVPLKQAIELAKEFKLPEPEPDTGYGILNDGKGGTKVQRHPEKINNRRPKHPQMVSALDGNPYSKSLEAEAYRYPESITTHRLADGSRAKGTRDVKGNSPDEDGRPANRIWPGSHQMPIASAGRAAALRSVVPRELVEEWRDACERDIDGSKAKPRNIMGW